MTGEPELHPYTSGEWVTYLQQVLKHYGRWNGAEDGEFNDELLQAVRALQSEYQINPADGVVRADTWAVLTGATNTSHAGNGGQPEAGAHAGGGGSGEHQQAMHPTGAQAHEVPASFQSGGLPEFQYELPGIPIAELQFDTGEAAVELKLKIVGTVAIKFEHGAEGVATNVAERTWELSAAQSLHGITEGISVQGIGGSQPSFGTTFGNEFHQTEAVFTPPNTMKFSGTCVVNYRIQTDAGMATVEGQPGYELEITVTPHPQGGEERQQEVTDEQSWLSQHSGLVAVGAVVLVVVVAIALAPETGGGSLVLAGAAL